jgi:hypothetical protein
MIHTSLLCVGAKRRIERLARGSQRKTNELRGLQRKTNSYPDLAYETENLH